MWGKTYQCQISNVKGWFIVVWFYKFHDFHMFMQVSPIFQTPQSDANKGILHLWSKFGGPSPNGWWVMARTSSKWGKFWLWSSIWPWRSRSITHKNNRDLNQGLLHLWSKFGDPSLNGFRVIAQTSKWLTHRLTDIHTRTHTDAGDNNTPRPKLASGKNAFESVVCEMASILTLPQCVNPSGAATTHILGWLVQYSDYCCSLHHLPFINMDYRQVSNIRRTKSQNLNASRLVLSLSAPNPLKPCVKLRMKM